MVVQDSLILEYLIEKEILTFDKDISPIKLSCIKDRLIGLVQQCSRSSHKDDSRHFTIIENKPREELTRESATIKASQISEIINNCHALTTVEDNALTTVEDNIIQVLKPNDDDLIVQCIEEANDDDETIAYSSLIFLEHLGRDMKIYDSKKLRAFLKRSIYHDNKIEHLSSFLDIVKRMLHSSTKLDNNPGFQIYVKKNMRQRLIEIIASFDDKHWNSKSNAFQIIHDYEIVAANERTQLYVKTLLGCIRDCDHTHYQKNVELLTLRIPNDTHTVRVKEIQSFSNCPKTVR